ncbi:hypothetical protein IGI04_037143, partial [Brassica rapa subsp. trilocularis]
TQILGTNTHQIISRHILGWIHQSLLHYIGLGPLRDFYNFHEASRRDLKTSTAMWDIVGFRMGQEASSDFVWDSFADDNKYQLWFDRVSMGVKGRNYNYHTRPQCQLMLWELAAPVYPKLIQEIPEGLTKDEGFMVKGMSLKPTCKLSKNKVYVSLVKEVSDAFELSHLVKVDCPGLEPSDYEKISAELKVHVFQGKMLAKQAK